MSLLSNNFKLIYLHNNKNNNNSNSNNNSSSYNNIIKKSRPQSSYLSFNSVRKYKRNTDEELSQIT
jgi:hypothetical protein